MARDRLAELQGSDRENRISPAQLDDIPLNPVTASDEPAKKLPIWTHYSTTIEDMLHSVTEQLSSLEMAQTQVLKSAEGVPHDEIGSIMNDLNFTISDIRIRLKEYHSLITELPADEARLASAQHRVLTKRLLDTITHYRRIEEGQKSFIMEKLKRQYRIVNPNATDEEIQHAAENAAKEGSRGVFAQSMLSSRAGADMIQLQNAKAEVDQRHLDIQQIEKTITDLTTLFADLSLLLETQEDYITNIVTQTEQTDANLERASGELDEGVKLAWSARR
ncbi:t-SNARE [Paraphysoderma sedebokerense]|nr:t-SNARE [Paraphysoderma sedebokerense]